jgi:hypothetical protein
VYDPASKVPDGLAHRVKLGLLTEEQLKQFEAFRRSKLDRRTVAKVTLLICQTVLSAESDGVSAEVWVRMCSGLGNKALEPLVVYSNL